MTAAEEFEQRYLTAFERHVDAPAEEALSAAYEVGRSAVREGLSVLDLATAHNDALLAIASGPGDRDLASALRAGGEFFLEAVSAFEMLQRVLQEARESAAVERRQAVVLRQLSSFLGDASIALDASSSMAEMLQLVAEHAREVIGAKRCLARLALDDGQPELAAEALADEAADSASVVEPVLSAPLTALDGRHLGSIRLFAKQDGEFTELDEAVLVQLAQMASAAMERAQLYRR